MTIDENYTKQLCDTVAKTIVSAFENLTIEDVNMYQLGYNKAIEDFFHKCLDENIQFYADPIDCMIEVKEQLKR